MGYKGVLIDHGIVGSEDEPVDIAVILTKDNLDLIK